MTLKQALKNIKGKKFDAVTCSVLGCFAHTAFNAIHRLQKPTNEQIEDAKAIKEAFPWVEIEPN